MFGALAQALPTQVAADGAGGSTLPSFGGRVAGRNFVFSECIMGTWGATSEHDGQEGVPHMASNQANVPVEMIEADYPIRIERYGFVADTGGPGQFRGGLSLVREYRVLTDDVYFGVRSDKCHYPPHGLFGGGEGAPSENLLNPDGDARRLPPMPTHPVTLDKGDVYRHIMAGGGGYGNPNSRAPHQVREDLLDGRISREHARSAYGVVLGIDAAIDWEATRKLRGSSAEVGVGGSGGAGGAVGDGGAVTAVSK
jgi:N-methylhydantoinase B